MFRIGGKKMTGYSDAQRRSTNKYKKEKVDSITFYPAKGRKDLYKSAAAAAGLSLNQWLIQAAEKHLATGSATKETN